MGEPIRILHVVTQMNRAGLESRLMDIYRNIDRSRVQFDFYMCNRNPGFFDDEIRSLGGKIYYEETLSIMNLPNIAIKFSDFFIKHPQYKIVHCHRNAWCGFILKGAKRAGVPIRIAHSRSALRNDRIKNIVKNIIKLSVNRYATHRFAVSQKAGKWLFGAKAMKKGGVRVYPNAIDVSKFIFSQEGRELKRREFGINDEKVLIHVGNIVPGKNHEFLLSVFYELLKKCYDTILLVVGADHRKGFVQRMAKKMGISERIRFLGSRADIPELLWAADVFVFPSLYEGFPGAVLEAQAADLPCVVADTITKEICLVEHIVQLSIKDNVNEWVEQVLGYMDTPRSCDYKTIESKGYDIGSLSKKMEEFYIGECNMLTEVK